MRILLLTQILPYPPDAGPRIKTWHVLRFLVERGHRVTLASFVRPEEQPHLPVLQKMCERVLTVPIWRSRLADVRYWLRSHGSGRPFLIERDDVLPMRRLIDDVVSKGEVEVLHVDQLTMTQFALSPRFESNGRPARRLPFRLFDAHNATWTIVARMGHNVLWPFSPVLALEAKRIKRYEGGVVRQFDHTLAVSDIDHQALLHAARASKTAGQMRPDHISVIPIAIDTVQLQPVHRLEDAPRILTLGTLHYPPNANGIRWFIRQVFPLIRQAVPNATLTVVGKNPPSDFVRWAEQLPEAIRVTGYVPDLTPLLERASVMVVPVLAGGGMRVRILEAFARGVPVVTTTVGLEGIDAKPDEDVLVADTPEQFASAVTRILHEQRLQDRLASNGRRLVVSRYDWQVVLEQLDVVYQTAFRGPSEAVG